MITYTDFRHTTLTAGYRGPLRRDEFYCEPCTYFEERIKHCKFVMNRRNTNMDCQHQPVNLDGFAIDPLDTVNSLVNHLMDRNAAREIYLADGRSSYDGISLVLPNKPKPVVEIEGKNYFLVAGLYKNSCKIRFDWDYTSRKRTFFATLSETFQTDMISLGNPLYGLSPHGKGNYFFGLSEYPVPPFEDKDKSIFSYGGVIALGSSYHNDYEETGIETEIKILQPSALRLIEKWRQEAANNAI